MTVHIKYGCTDCKDEFTQDYECPFPPGITTVMDNGKAVMTVGPHVAPTYILCGCGGICLVRDIINEVEQPEPADPGKVDDNNGDEASV